MVAYRFEGDVQGVGLRKTLHSLLDDMNLPGMAYNDARANKVFANIEGTYRQRRKILDHLRTLASDDNFSAKPTRRKQEQVDVAMTDADLRNMAIRQGMTQDAQLPINQLRNRIGDRFRLKETDGKLVGKVAPHALKQLLGEEPVYHAQITHPEQFNFQRWDTTKASSSVLAHIGGASGSGKSTLLDEIAKSRPDIVTKDLDEFDDIATKQLKLPPKWKTDYSDEMLKNLADRRQQLMDQWVTKQKNPVVLAGHHIEGSNVLNIPTDKKLLLDTPAWLSAWRGYVRSQRENPEHRRKLWELPQDWSEARRDISQLKNLNYSPTSKEDILRLLTEKTSGIAAKGIPDRSDLGDLSKLQTGQLYDWIVQRHLAQRAGEHYDVRFGNPDTGLYSWASRKGLPLPGEKRLAVQQPLHTHSYGAFEGTIPEGYGKGEVSKHDEGRVLVTKVEPGKVHITVAHRRYPERYVLVKPTSGKGVGENPNNWLLMNTTPTQTIPFEKQHYKAVPADKIEPLLANLQPGGSAQAKIDGALTLTKLLKDKLEVMSYRKSKVCFAANTPVDLPDGTTIPIINVVPGMLVATPNGPRRVIARHDNGIGCDWMELHTGDGRRIVVTPQHHFLVHDIGWVAISMLEKLQVYVDAAGVLHVDTKDLSYLRHRLYSDTPSKSDLQQIVWRQASLANLTTTEACTPNNNGAPKIIKDTKRSAPTKATKKYAKTRGRELVTCTTSNRWRCANNYCIRDWMQPANNLPNICAFSDPGSSRASWQEASTMARRIKARGAAILESKITRRDTGEKIISNRRALRILPHNKKFTSPSSSSACLFSRSPAREYIVTLPEVPRRGRQIIYKAGKMPLCISKLPGFVGRRFDLEIADVEHWYKVAGLIVHNSDRPIVHTERTFSTIPNVEIPKQYQGSVLKGELYGQQHGKESIPPQALGGLLNSALGKSLDSQRQQNIKLKQMIFDIQQIGKKPVDFNTVPYEQRSKTIRDILGSIKGPDASAVQSTLHPPEEAKTPDEALRLYKEIASGKHSATEEGIVIHPPTGKPLKSKLFDEHDVHIRGFFPGQGKWQDKGVGGFVYSHEPKSQIVGEVGTGFTDAMRQELFQNPNDYIGRVARVRTTGKMPSGALFQPSLISLHEG